MNIMTENGLRDFYILKYVRADPECIALIRDFASHTNNWRNHFNHDRAPEDQWALFVLPD